MAEQPSSLATRCLSSITLRKITLILFSLVSGFNIFKQLKRSRLLMATHSSTLAWKIPWTEEPGGLQSMASLRIGHDWVTSLSLFTFMHWRRKWQPTPVFLPGESQDEGAWWAAVYGVAQSRTRLKWLSSSSKPLKINQNHLLPIHPHKQQGSKRNGCF